MSFMLLFIHHLLLWKLDRSTASVFMTTNQLWPNFNSDLMNGDTSVDRRWLETSDDLIKCSCNIFKDKLSYLYFQLTRPEFYRLPQWKRNDLKKRVKLFWAALSKIWTYPELIWPTRKDLSKSDLSLCWSKNICQKETLVNSKPVSLSITEARENRKIKSGFWRGCHPQNKSRGRISNRSSFSLKTNPDFGVS